MSKPVEVKNVGTGTQTPSAGGDGTDDSVCDIMAQAFFRFYMSFVGVCYLINLALNQILISDIKI